MSETAKNEIVTSYMGPIRVLSISNRSALKNKQDYKDTFLWLFDQVPPGTDYSTDVVDEDSLTSKVCRLLHPLYHLYVARFRKVQTREQFQRSIFKNNYFRQCFRVVKKLVQPFQSSTTPDTRAYTVWSRHINIAVGFSPDTHPVCPPRYWFRTVFIDGMFPDDRALPHPLCATLYCSVLHKGIQNQTGLFAGYSPSEKAKSKHRKGAKRNNAGNVVGQTQDEGDPIEKANQYRLRTVKTGNCPCSTLSGIILALVDAWDTLAHFLQFRSCDTMLSPYLRFNLATLQYECVPDGLLAPYSQSHTFDEETTAPVPPSAQDCASFAVVFYEKRNPSGRIEAQTIDPEKFLRGLAALFVTQVYSQCMDTKYYLNTPTPDAVKMIETFVGLNMQQGPLPACIEDKIDMTSLRAFSSLHNSLILSNAISDTSYFARGPATVAHRSVRHARQPEEEGSEQDLPTASTDAETATNDDFVHASSAFSDRPLPPKSVCPQDCACYSADKEMLTFLSPYCRFYHCSFEDLRSTDMTEAGQYVTTVDGAVQLVLTDPPYNVRRKTNRVNSAYDTISKHDMNVCADAVTELLAPGGHLVLFCSAAQFHLWYKIFNSYSTDSGKTFVYQVDSTPIQFTPYPGHHSRKGSPLTFVLRNISEWALHAFRKPNKSDGQQEALSHVDYKVHGHIASTFSGYTNVINNIPRLAPGERVRDPSPGSSLRDAAADEDQLGGNTYRSRALRPEQKNVKLIRELISRFTAPGDMVVDLFSGTFTTAAAALSLPQHRVFVGCDLDPLCVELGKQRILNQFATAVRSEWHCAAETDIEVPGDIQNKATLFYSHVTERSAEAAKTVAEIANWSPPDDMPSSQILPAAVASAVADKIRHTCELVHRFGRKSQDLLPKLYETVETLPASQWPASLSSILAELDMEDLLGVDARANRVIVDNSDPGHSVVRSNIAFPTGRTIGTINGSIVYRDLRNEILRNRTKIYGTGIYAVSPVIFRDSALLLVPLQNNKVVEKDIYLVPAPFSSLGLALLKGGLPNETNAQLRCSLKKKTLTTRKELVQPGILSVVASRPIARFDCIYIDCSGFLFEK